MPITRSKSGVSEKVNAYADFMGMDDSRPSISQDTGEKQSLLEITNGFCDWRGQIVRDPVATYRQARNAITHVRFYGTESVVFAERNDAYISMSSDREHRMEDVYPANAVVNSVVFNREVHVFVRALKPYIYNGVLWRENTSESLNALKPAFGVVVGRRLAVAGISDRPTEVHLSRVDDDTAFPDDESPSETSVLRAGMIDIANIAGVSDEITGLAQFEQSKLVMFTRGTAYVYKIDPDITQWEIEQNTSVRIGCLSHGTIVSAGTDILFCSSKGVHSLRRSRENGITIYNRTLSAAVRHRYLSLLRMMDDTSRITAAWDEETNRYLVFFPISETHTERLTLALSEDEQIPPKWSRGDYLKAICADSVSARLVFGTPGGLYEVEDLGYFDDDSPSITMEVLTPVFWLGSLHEQKMAYAYILQADGDGDVVVEVMNQDGAVVGGDTFEAQPDDNGLFPTVPLSQRYKRKLEVMAVGLQFRIRVTGKGLFRISGLAIITKK